MLTTIILTALTVRISIALLTQTFFQPDEYFQSLEVAHHLVFGYGHLTWEWLSDRPLRSILYPSLNVPIYYALKWLQLDDNKALIWAPKVLHGTLASLTDIGLYILAKRVLGKKYGAAALLVSCTSLFNGLSLTRSMSNSLETSLTTISLSVFPWEAPSRKALRTSIVIAALACAVRPTNTVIWTYTVCVYLWRCRANISIFLRSVADVAIIGIFSVALLCGLDTLYYGELTFTPWNFVLTNLSSVSLFYGSNAWHYYLTQGLPILCTTSLPFVLHGAWIAFGPRGTTTLKQLLGLVVWTISIYSLAGHKEWRFIHPLLPLLHLFAAKSLVDLYEAHSPTPKRGNNKTSAILPIRPLHLILLLLNLPALAYLSFFHARAQINVIHYFRSLPEDQARSVGFLMPCHSTPWQAYLHKPSWSDGQRFWALGCEPPLQYVLKSDEFNLYLTSPSGQAIQDYKDQTDVFYESPISYLQDRFPPKVNTEFPPSPLPYTQAGQLPGETLHDWQHQWPEYLVMFGALLHEPEVHDLLTELGFETIWQLSYGLEGDHRRRGGVVVLKYV